MIQCVHTCVRVCWNNAVLSSLHIGFLPLSQTINRRCVEAAVQTSVSLSAQFNLLSYFDRKHYFYPDLPVSWAVGWEAGGRKELEGGRGEGRWEWRGGVNKWYHYSGWGHFPQCTTGCLLSSSHATSPSCRVGTRSPKRECPLQRRASLSLWYGRTSLGSPQSSQVV